MPETSRLSGVAASGGVAIGEARVLAPPVVVIDRRIAPDLVPAELERLRGAVDATDAQLGVLSLRLEEEGLHEGQMILETHRLMLRDDKVVRGASRLIEREGLGAESAVRTVIDGMRDKFRGMADPYLRERGADIEAVGERLLRTLLGLPELSAAEQAPGTIGVVSALSPIDALHFHRSGLIGFAAEHGGRTSHASIILRSLGIPFVVGARGLLAAVRSGDPIIVDGSRGELIARPDAATLSLYRERQGAERAREQALRSRRDRAITLDGVAIELAANIETPDEVALALENGAESVGLFRTELLYLDRPELPGEEEQFRDAVAVLEALGGRPAIFRTLDLGGDKLPLAVPMSACANPSLGVRSIRFARTRPDIFRVQMRALFRAAAVGPLRIMFPLVSGIAELIEVRRTCAEIAEALAREGAVFAPEVPIGVMLETPSAALTVDHLAAEASFFSVGTNDLIQYTFAADRENEDVEYLYHPLHPAFLRLLASTIGGARAAGKPLAVCGDMAGDPGCTWILLALGVRSLSMSPRLIPAVRSIVAQSTLAEMEALLPQAMALRTGEEVEQLLLGAMGARFPLELAPLTVR